MNHRTNIPTHGRGGRILLVAGIMAFTIHLLH